MKTLIISVLLMFSSLSFSQDGKSDLAIKFVQGHGYYMNVYDLSPEMMNFMNTRNLHGGGPTWIVLLETALKLESPSTLPLIQLDDESSAVQVRANNKDNIEVVKIIALKLMSDREYLNRFIELSAKGGRLE